MIRYLFAMVVILIVVSGCSSTNGSTWLIQTSSCEISVSEAGDAWNDLDPAAKSGFLAGNNPIGDFLSALGQKTIVTQEISNETYLFSPAVQSMKDCWARSASFVAYQDSLSAATRREISETDMQNYRELLGTIVWYSSGTGDNSTLSRLPDLEWNVAFAFDSMTPGTSIEIEGTVYTLDSVVTSPREMIEATLQDTARVNAFILSSLTESQVNRALLSLRNESLESLEIDTTAVHEFCSNRNSLNDNTSVATWQNHSVSTAELDGIASFASMGHPEVSCTFEWICHNLRNQARQSQIAEAYAGEFPEDYLLILQQAEDFALDQASELLFRENVSDVIFVTDSMTFAVFTGLDSVPLLPESRIFESVMVPAGLLDQALAVMSQENALLEFGFSGYTNFLSPGSEFISRPVFQSELPENVEAVLFSQEDDDTSWQRPVEIQEDLFLFTRLVEIVPPHPTSYEHFKETIEHNLKMHLEEQRTMEWICELEEAHQLQINREILDDLPPDPSAWSRL